MVRMLELKVIDQHGRIVRRVAVDEDLFNLVLRRKRDLGTIWFGRFLVGIFKATAKGGVLKQYFTTRAGTSVETLFKYPVNFEIFNITSLFCLYCVKT